jgi:hypothetical protein
MRYQCDIPGLENNFVEFSDAWSRAQRRALRQLNGDTWLQLLAGNVIAIHLDCPDGEPLTTLEGVTNEMFEAVDMRVWDWFQFVPIAHVHNLDNLGETSGRRLLGMNGESAAQPTTSPTPTPTPGS